MPSDADASGAGTDHRDSALKTPLMAVGDQVGPASSLYHQDDTPLIIEEEVGSTTSLDRNDTGSTASARDPLARESERMLFFTDAVVAIGITLLILPLMEAATELGEKEAEGGGHSEESNAQPAHEGGGLTVDDFYRSHWRQIAAFFVTFVTVWSVWTGHIFLFAYISLVPALMLTLNALWIASVMFLPVANTLMYDGWLLPYYVVLTCINVVVALMRHALRRVDLHESRPSDYSLVRSYVWILCGVCAMPIDVFAPDGWAFAGILVVAVGPPKILWVLRRCGLAMDDDVDILAARCGPSQFIGEALHYVTRKVLLATGMAEPFWMKRRIERRQMKHRVVRRNRELFGRISDRMIIFTDAVVAISMTLLIIPISAKSQAYTDQTVFFRDQARLMAGFFISFFFIFIMWKDHDSLFSFVEGKIPPLCFVYTLPHLATVAYFPVASALYTADPTQIEPTSMKTAQFVIVLLFGRIVQLVLTFIVFGDDKGLPSSKIVDSTVGVLLGALTLALAFAIPPEFSEIWPPMIMFLTWPLSKLILRKWPDLGDIIARLT